MRPDHVEPFAKLLAAACGVTRPTNVPSLSMRRVKSASSSYRTAPSWLKEPRHDPTRSFGAYEASTASFLAKPGRALEVAQPPAPTSATLAISIGITTKRPDRPRPALDPARSNGAHCGVMVSSP